MGKLRFPTGLMGRTPRGQVKSCNWNTAAPLIHPLPEPRTAQEQGPCPAHLCLPAPTPPPVPGGEGRPRNICSPSLGSFFSFLWGLICLSNQPPPARSGDCWSGGDVCLPKRPRKAFLPLCCPSTLHVLSFSCSPSSVSPALTPPDQRNPRRPCQQSLCKPEPSGGLYVKTDLILFLLLQIRE